MKLATMIAAVTAASIGAVPLVALAQGSTPPVPRAAAGALPQAAAKAENKSHRTQNAEEKKSATSAPAVPLTSSRTGAK